MSSDVNVSKVGIPATFEFIVIIAASLLLVLAYLVPTLLHMTWAWLIPAAATILYTIGWGTRIRSCSRGVPINDPAIKKTILKISDQQELTIIYHESSGGAAIESTLLDPDESDDDGPYRWGVDGIESFILSLVSHGVDVSGFAPALGEALDQLANQTN